MTTVGIREFWAGRADFVTSPEPVAVTRHGVTVGWFIPTPRGREEETASLRSAASALDELLLERGVETEEIVAEDKSQRRR